jgi:thioredoxin reductase (NADPH)
MSVFPIVIIGAGPAGIASAIEAIKRGYKAEEIIILEKSDEIAHMVSSKYPNEKRVLANYKGRISECLGDMCITDMSKVEFFDYLHEVTKKYKLQIQIHQDVSKITKLKNGQFNVVSAHDTYTCDAVFVAIGNMATPRTLGVAIDPCVSKYQYFDIQNVALEDKKILVVGGGDSAAEYCKILIERGHDVYLSYRGDEFNRMIEQNAKDTKELIAKKVLTYFPNSQIEKIEVQDDRPLVIFKENKYPVIGVSAIVVALGTERPHNYLNSIGISTVMETGEFFSESEMSGLFFVGDLASGKNGGSINFAFNSGVSAVSMACEMYLDCKLPQS